MPLLVDPGDGIGVILIACLLHRLARISCKTPAVGRQLASTFDRIEDRLGLRQHARTDMMLGQILFIFRTNHVQKTNRQDVPSISYTGKLCKPRH
jgi:hypothetical protein